MENIQFSIDFDGRKLMRDDKRSCLIIVDNQQKNLPDILKKRGVTALSVIPLLIFYKHNFPF